jgi:hypothetical protein
MPKPPPDEANHDRTSAAAHEGWLTTGIVGQPSIIHFDDYALDAPIAGKLRIGVLVC